jgi:Xaa-Pro dipeptidase
MIPERITRLLAGLRPAGLDAVAITPGPNMLYLTGLHFHVMERPTVVLFTPDSPPAIILPELETGKISSLPYDLRAFPYSENPATWPDAFQKAIQATGLDGLTIGVEPKRMRYLELGYLQAAAPRAHFVSAEKTLSRLRLEKDDNEADAIRKAVAIAQNGFLEAIKQVKAGMTELELAAELAIQLLRAGSATDLPFQPIIAGGPNGANPHAAPTDRKLEKGDLVVVDWGATYDGYYSDITRTLAIGIPEAELYRIAAVVKEANAAGRAAGRPGVPAGDVDRAARAVIEKAGYGPYFTHRTGHGLGMEEHEEPYMFGENGALLTPGMVYTVEPGIYLPGRAGVRIEDDVLVTADGSQSLSDLPRDLFLIE